MADIKWSAFPATTAAAAGDVLVGLHSGANERFNISATPAASAVALWDANVNFSAHNLIDGYSTTVTAGGTTILTVGSNKQQYFTGSTTQEVTMPVTSTLVLGQLWRIVNLSSGIVTVKSSGGNTIVAVPANSEATVTCILTSGTSAASWSTTNTFSVPLPIAQGGTGVTSVTSVPVASAWAGWDVNKNLFADNFIAGYTTTVTAAGTTLLTVDSTFLQYFTGSTSQVITMPVTSTLVTGFSFHLVNNSTSNITVNSSGGNAIRTMEPNSWLSLTCINTGVTTAAGWNQEYGLRINNGAYLPLWNASTNTPSLASSTVGLEGVIYLVQIAGSTTLDGISSWAAGDYAYFIGGVWTRLLMIEATSVQTLSNKKLLSGSTTFNDTTTPTKAMNFDLASMTAAKTGTIKWLSTDDQTVTIPDGNGGEDFTVVGTSVTQTIINKLIGNSEIDATTITTACDYVDNADDTKTWELNLSGKTTATKITSVYTGGAQTITYPTGDFTVAKANESQIGNVTPYVVGASTAVAPYTSIDTAIIAANAAFVSMGFKQMVYIQPGQYTQDFTPLAGVDITGLGYSSTFHTAANSPTCAVKIIGQIILTNTVNINIVGIEFDASSTVTITSTGSNAPNVNFVYCILKKSGGTGASMFSATNTNVIATFSNCLLYGGTSKRIFDVDGGSYYLEDCTQQASSNAEATFDGTAINYNNCVINDSIRIQNAALLKMTHTNLVTGGNFAAIILDHAASHAEVNYGSLSAAPGFTNYVIEGAIGATVKVNNVTYLDLSAIEADIIASSYAQSFNLGNTTVKTSSGAVTLTPLNSIIGLAKGTPATTVVNLPAAGSYIGQSYEITDLNGDASSFNITLTPASGTINGAATYVMNIDRQSVTVRDYGTTYAVI